MELLRPLLEAVLRQVPESALAHFDLGVLDEADKRDTEALEQYRRATALARKLRCQGPQAEASGLF